MDGYKNVPYILIHKGVLLSHKKNGIMPFAGKWVEREIIMLSKISQTEKEKCQMFSLYVESSVSR
jgi:hypothetical protein